jgi:hypothetical protein
MRRGRLAGEAEAAREYRVAIRAVGARFVARLEFVDAAGTTRTREVGADSCPDAANAIALVTALAIDAAGTDSEKEVAGEGTPSASETLGLVPAEPSAAEPAPSPIVPVASPRGEPPGYREPRPEPPHFVVGVQATLASAKAPNLAPGAELFAGLRDEKDLWLVEMGVAGERSAETERGPGSVRFSYVGARLHGCAFSLALGASFDLRPCAVFEAGALVGEGFIAHPSTQVDAWLAAGPAIRLGYGGAPWSLRLEAGPMFSITRNDYVFGPAPDPRATAHDVPLVGFYGALGGALQIF